MDYKNIVLGLQVHGYPITIEYLANEEIIGRSAASYHPIGRKIKYIIQGNEYIIYKDIPTIIKNYNQVDVVEKRLFNDILRMIVDQMRKSGLMIYQDKGILIEYIEDNRLINLDNRIVTLISDTTPRQDQIRVIIDMTDQVVGPSANVTIFCQLNGKFIEQYKTRMMFAYEDNTKFIVFYSNDVGIIKVHAIKGNVIAILSNQFITYLQREYMRNFPEDNNNITIYVMAMQVDINYLSVMYDY